MNKLKIFFGYLILFGIWFLGFGILFLNIAKAQTLPQFLVSWQAESYVPSWYQGKIFPTKNSIINIGFELIDNGKTVDISNEKVRWYINDDLIANEKKGLGLKSLKFMMRNYAGEETNVRIEIFHYKGREGSIYKIFKIPSVKPEIVIDSPYLNNKINTGFSNFNAYPFFFNLKSLDDLKVEWLVMGQKANIGGNPWQLNLNINQDTPKNSEINLSVSVRNLLSDLEFASQSLKLFIQ